MQVTGGNDAVVAQAVAVAHTTGAVGQQVGDGAHATVRMRQKEVVRHVEHVHPNKRVHQPQVLRMEHMCGRAFVKVVRRQGHHRMDGT